MQKGRTMNVRNLLKRVLPSYRIERRLNDKIEMIKKNQKESNRKNEYLFWLSQKKDNETLFETKRRVFLDLPKATGNLRYIQIAENYILQKVKDICDANHLELFLMGGTLLGALRHHGFIPWDNDVDIGMMKSDFLKLKQILQKDNLFSLEYYYKYENGTKVSKVKFKNNEVFFIDIFVFDYIDATEETADQIWNQTLAGNKAHREKIQELTKNLQNQTYIRPVANYWLDTEIEKFERKQLEELPVFGHGSYFCETMDSPYWSRDDRGIYRVSNHFPLLKDEVEFEGRTYDTWRNYENALEHFFGDIWSFPFSISEPHTTEFDEGLDEGIVFLREMGIIE